MHLEDKIELVDQGRVSEADTDEATRDLFERIDDNVLLQIFNKVENVTVKVDCVISGEDNGLNTRCRGVFGHVVRFLVGSIVKPFQALQHVLGPRKTMLAEVSHHSPSQVLKNFNAVQNLRIELPGGELGIEDGVLLKWRAEFGSTLDNCVILGASALVKPSLGKKRDKSESRKSWFYQDEVSLPIAEESAELVEDDGGSLPESFYTNGGLKLRVVWTISSLIAASARHFLLQQIILEHPTLFSLILTDADGQGKLSMSKKQLDEFKNKPLAASASSNRTQIPALNMKLWYASYLELPGGGGLKGATLVAIRPSDHPIRKEHDSLISAAFEEPFTSAASLLVKRRTYLLEMNSF